MRQQRPGWKDRVRKVWLSRVAEGKYGDKVTRELWVEWKRASVADKAAAARLAKPEQIAAQIAVHHAVTRGNLVRPSTCSRCGKRCKPEGHHHSYAIEDQLDVEWLCPECHHSNHRRWD